MKVLFDTKKVQKLGRIAFTEQLLRNAGLQEGDSVNIYFDASSRRIILERAEKPLQHIASDATVATGSKA